MLFLTLLFLLFTPSLAVQIEGGCLGQPVKVYTDVPAIVVFRLNNGTPIFAESPATFTPRVEGTLRIDVMFDDKKETKFLEIRTCRYEYRCEKLEFGTFKKILDGKEVEIDWRTALGALEKASKMKGFEYRIKLTDWGIFVDCIREYCTGYAGKTSGWMYWVNYPKDPMPGVSADKYRIKAGDEIVWFFVRGMQDRPEDALYLIRIYIDKNYCIFVSEKKKVENVPPVADFDYYWKDGKIVFESKSYDPDGFIVEYIWKIDGMVFYGKKVELYLDEGIYKVKHTVIDNGEQESSKEIEIFVKREDKKKKKIEEIFIGKKELTLKSFRINKSLEIEPFELKVTLRSNDFAMVEIEEINPPKVIYADVLTFLKIKTNTSLNVSFEFINPLKIYIFDEDWRKLNSSLIVNGTVIVATVTEEWRDFPIKDERIHRAIKYLKSLQRENGGYANPGEEENVAKTSWAIMALASAGEKDLKALEFIRKRINYELPKMGTSDIARTILALISAEENPRNFSGIDLVEKLKEKVKNDGQIGDFVYTTIWGVIALKAVGEDVSKSVEWLKRQQNPDGGFPWASGELSDYDDTAAAIQALIYAGELRNSEVVLKALRYLKTGQNEDGGMRYFGEGASNSASSSWTIQALVSAGINPREWIGNNISVVDYLLSLQSEEGYFNYTSWQTSNPGYMTVCAIMALLGKPFPIKLEKIKEEIKEVKEKEKEKEIEERKEEEIKKEKPIVKETPAEHGIPRIPGFEVLIAIISLALLIIIRIKVR